MAQITDLPPEILQQIINSVIESRSYMGPICASVSQQWQAHSEMVMFSSLRLTQERIKSSAQIMTQSRRSYVRYIHMRATLPEYDADESLRLDYSETEDDKQQNVVVFTDAVELLFRTLAAWEVSAVESNQPLKSITLSISASSPSDSLYAMDNTYLPEHDVRHRNARRLMNRWEDSYLGLQSDAYEGFPVLRMISEFHCPIGYPHRKISPSACCEIAALLPNAHTLFWVLDDGELHDLERRIDAREQFAAKLALVPLSVQHFTLMYNGNQINSPDLSVPCLIKNNAELLDPLSMALHNLARQLVTLNLDGPIVVDDELLWTESPGVSESTWDTNVSSYFPHLEHVRICRAMVTASGSWLFRPKRAQLNDPFEDPDEFRPGDEPMHQLEWAVIPEVANKFFTAAFNSAAHMPRLKFMELELASPESLLLLYDRIGQDMWVDNAVGFDFSDEAVTAWKEASRVHPGNTFGI